MLFCAPRTDRTEEAVPVQNGGYLCAVAAAAMAHGMEADDRIRKAATGLARGRREAGLRTPGTDRRGWPARSIPDLC